MKKRSFGRFSWPFRRRPEESGRYPRTKKRQRLLQYEPLEERMLLATDVIVRLAFTDTNGTVLSSAQVGQEIFLTASVSDMRDAAAGVAKAYFNLSYNSSVAELSGTQVFHSEAYSITSSGTNVLTAGAWTAVGGEAESSDALAGYTQSGDPADTLTLFTVPMVATATGDLVFTVSEATALSDAIQMFVTDSSSLTTVPFDNVEFLGSDSSTDIKLTIVEAGPAVTSFLRNVPADTTGNFLVKDFTQNFTDLVAGQENLLYVKITALPDNGTLKLDGTAVAVNQVIPVADLDLLTYTPASGAEVGDSGAFSWTGSANGTDYAAETAMATIVVMDADLSINYAPDLSPIGETISSGAMLVFTTAEFDNAVTDLDLGDAMETVSITALPAHGTLYYDGAVVTSSTGPIAAANLGKLTYVSNSGYTGTDSFSWNASDGEESAYNPSTVNLTITAATGNQVPTLADSSKSTSEDTEIAFTAADFTANFSDANSGDSLQTVKIITVPTHGTLKLSGTAVTVNQEIDADQLGNLTYEPDADYHGSDSFQWNGSDGTAYAGGFATLSLPVSEVNDAPTLAAISDPAAINENSGTQTVALSGISAGDSESQALAVTVVSSNTALTGTPTVTYTSPNTTGSLSYTPVANQSGTATITVTVKDAGLDGTLGTDDDGTVSRQFTVTVTAGNTAPTVTSSSKTVNEDTVLTFTAADFTGNFSDADGDTLQAIKIVQLPYHGTLSLDGVAVTNGQEITAANLPKLTYQGTGNYAGSDSFMWQGSDGTIYATADATVTITVSPVNDAPTVASSTESLTSSATTFYFDSDTFADHFSDADSDALASVKILALPSHGTLYLNSTAVAANDVIALSNLSKLTYVPSSSSTGLDSFTWNGSDGTAYAGTSAVMSFAYSSDLPTLTDSTKTIATNATLTFTAADFTGHFSDPGVNGLLYTVKITALPAHGTLYLDGTAVTAGQVIDKADLGSLTYVSDSSYTGTVTVDWNASNGKAYAAADAMITITCSADVPTVSNLSVNLATDTTLTFTAAQFTSCFTDLNPGHSLTSVKITTLPTHGTLKLNGTAVTADQVIAASSLANLTYTPTSSYTGTDTILWKGTDGTTYSATAATITITVAADVPVVSNSTKTVATGSSLTFAATDFSGYFADYNAAHSLTSVKITTLPSHGTLYLSGTAVTANQVIAASSLASLTYTPTSSYTGADTIQWTGTDGTTYATTAATITVTVAAEIPTVSASTQTIASGATLNFDASDFTSYFTDTTSTHSLQKVKITALPSHGTLFLDSTAVTANQEISVIDLWKLTYVASSSYTGTDTLSWSGSDGTTYSASSAAVTITVKADTPTLTALTKKAATATTLTFTLADFTGHFSDPNPSHSLQKVMITSLPTNGTLKLLGTAVTVNQEIAYADLANLTYISDSGITGTDTFNWKGSDGSSYSSSASTVTITLASDTPVASTFTETVAKNTTLTFSVSDFTGNFTDYNAAHSLQLVKFTALPSHGTLKYNGVAVTTSQVFGVADLAKITYTPTADYTGTDTITWSGSDGTTYSSGATISITTTTDVPVVAGFSKTVATTTSSASAVLLSFTAADFTDNFTDYDASDSLQKIKITQLPTHGTLKLNGTAVTLNQEIALADLSKLTYQTNVNFVGTDTVKWNGSDGDSYATTAATIALNAVANVPVVSDFTKTIVAGTSTVTFTLADFTSSFMDPAGDALKIVKITQLPLHGTLKLNGTAVTVGQQINAADLASLTYVPTSTASTAYADAFKWVGMGSPYSANESTTTIDAQTDVPAVSSFTQTILIGATYTFTSSNFTSNFSDTNSTHSLQTVKITQLPSYGTLKLSGTAVTLNQEITLANLANLTYTSTATSAATDTIGWTASDGTTYATSSATIVFNAVSDSPTVSNFSKTVSEDTTLSFTASDFTGHFTDLDSTHSLQKVKITALPSHGTLYLSGTAVTANQEIASSSLANLTYVGTSNYNGSDSFTWVATDGTTYATTAATVAITVSAVNDLPTVSNSSKTTALNTQLTFAATDFSNYFSDVDSDTLQKVKITALPSHGTLKLSGTAVTVDQEIALASLANLTYDPTTSYSGTDTFTWIGSDGTGYATTGATLTITVSGSSSTGTASLSGSAYLDANRNGTRDSGEIGVKAVGIQLQQQGTDGTWSVVSSAMTDSSGNYSFTNLAAGTYKVLEISQPNCYNDSSETAGTAGGSVGSDVISGIVLDAGEAATGYLFGEAGPAARYLSLRMLLVGAPSVTEYLANLNATPTVDLNGSSSGTGSSAAYTSGDSAVKIASSAKITDTDSGCLNSLTATITNLGDGDAEVLAATTTGTGITATYGNGVLRLTGAASLATYQTVLQSITYKNSDTAPTTGDRSITVIVSDGLDFSDTVTATVTVKASSSTIPTASVTTAPATITASTGSTSTTTITVTYADSDNGIDTSSFGTSDITVDNGATVTSYSASGNAVTYTITAPSSTWSASTQGTYTISLAANQVKDLAGNYVAANSSLATFKVDTVVPTASLTTAPATITSSSSSGKTTTLVVTYADSGLGMDTSSYSTSNLTVSNGATVTAVSASGNVVTYTITAPAASWGASTQGTYTVALVASQVKDLAGNYVAANSSLTTFTVDTVAPTVTVNQASGQSDPTTGSTINFTVTFSESVTDFSSADVTLSGTATGTLVANVTGSGTTYNVAVTGTTGTGTVVASVAAGAAHDAAGNANTASTSTDNTVNYNTSNVTVTVNQASSQTDPTNGSTINYTVVFSQAVTDFTSADVTLGGTATGTLVANVTGSGTTYNVAVTGMTGSGTVIASLAAGVAHDSSGNANSASTSTDNTVTYDVTPPTASVTTAAPTITASNGSASTTTITVTYADTNAGLDTSSFATSNLTVSNGATVTGISASGNAVTYTITAPAASWGASTQGTYTVALVASQVKDLAGNYVAANSSLATFKVDTVVPTATVSTAAPTINASKGATSTTTITVTYADSGTGLDTSSFSTSNLTVNNLATVTNISVSGNAVTYTITAPAASWSASTQGTYTIALAANQVKDLAGNYVAANSSLATFTVDTVAPTVTIEQATGQTDPTNASTVNFTVIFSEAVTGFATGDVTFTGSTVGGTLVGTVTGSGTTYNVAVTGMSGSGTVIASLLAGVASDAAGNASAASTSTDNTVTYDSVVPTASVTTAPPTITASSASGTTTTLTVTYADSVAGIDTSSFATSNITVSNGATVTGISASGNAVTYTITAPAASWGASTQGTYTVALVASQVKDLAGNYVAANASLATFTVDTVAPTVTIDQATAQTDPANGDTINFTVVFSEAVTGFETGDVTFTGSTVGGTLVGTVTGSGTTYNVAVTGMTGSGTVIASLLAGVASDAAGNTSAASTSTDDTVTYDSVVPTASVTTAPPTITAANASGTTTTLTVTYADSGAGIDTSSFATSNLSVSNGATVTGISASGNAVTYTITAPAASWGASTQGTYAIALAANQVKDLAGNYVAANSSLATFTVDTVAPTVTVTKANGQGELTKDSPILFTVVFSEAVTGFETGEVTLSGTATGTLVGTVTGSGTTYQVSVAGMTSDGTVIASIAAGVASDAAGNANTATATSATVTYDTTAPTVTIDQAAAQSDPATSGPIAFTVVFSEVVTGFTGNDVTLVSSAGDTLTATITDSGDGKTYNVSVAGMAGSGTVTASIAAGVAEDAAGNVNVASTSTDNVVTYQAGVAGLSALSMLSGDEATVVQDGVTVTVTGTTAADTIQFVATASQYTLTVNGTVYAYNTSDVSSFVINGNGGGDTVNLTGDNSALKAVLQPNSATLQGGSFSVQVTNAKSIKITAGSGDSEAQLYDSAGNDSLVAEDLVASLTGEDFAETVVGFKRVTASGTNGGTNTASVGAVDFLLSQEGSWL